MGATRTSKGDPQKTQPCWILCSSRFDQNGVIQANSAEGQITVETQWTQNRVERNENDGCSVTWHRSSHNAIIIQLFFGGIVPIW